MWLQNILELKKEQNLTTRQLAERSRLPEKTVARFLSGKTKSPSIETIDRLAEGLGVSIGVILAGTRALVCDETVEELHQKVDELLAENEELRKKEVAFTVEVEKLKLDLLHKEELLEMHKEYMKLLSKS